MKTQYLGVALFFLALITLCLAPNTFAANYDNYTLFFGENFNDASYTEAPQWTVASGSAEIVTVTRLNQANLVMRDDFPGTSPDMSRWGKQYEATNLTISAGRMTMGEGGYIYINNTPMVNYVLEFNFKKESLTNPSDPLFMLQFRDSAGLNDNSALVSSLLFRPGGIAINPNIYSDPVLSNLGTDVGDSPLSLQIEVANGYVTLYTKSYPEGKFVQHGNPYYVSALKNRSTLVAFRSQGITASIGNIRLYREFPSPEENHALKMNAADSRLSASAFVSSPTNGKLTINYKTKIQDNGKSGGIYLVNSLGAGYGFLLTTTNGNSGRLSLEKTANSAGTTQTIKEFSVPLRGTDTWQEVSALWNIEEHTFELYLNGTLVGAERNADYTSFTKIIAYGSNDVQLDDIRINSTPETIIHVISWFTPIGALNGKALWGSWQYEAWKNWKNTARRELDYPPTPEAVNLPASAPSFDDEAYYELQYQANLYSEIPKMKEAGYSALVFDMTCSPEYNPDSPLSATNTPLAHYKTFLKWIEAARELGGIKVGLYVEAPGASGDYYPNPTPVLTPEDWQKCFKTSLDNLPNNNTVWKLNDKPVIMMFGNNKWLNSTGAAPYYDWKNMIDAVRQTHDFYFISDVHPHDHAQDRGKWAEVADAAYSFVPAAITEWLTGTRPAQQINIFNTFTNQKNYKQIPYYLTSSRGYYLNHEASVASPNSVKTYTLPDFRRIHNLYKTAIEQKAPGVHTATWNDFREETHIVPSERNKSAVLDIYAYYNTWLRTGVQPSAEEENVTISYPVNIPVAQNGIEATTHAESPNFLISASPAKGRVYYWANLKTPHTLRVNNSAAITLPAGLSMGELPEGITAGTVTAYLAPQNGGVTEIALTAIESINAEPANGGLGFQYKRLKNVSVVVEAPTITTQPQDRSITAGNNTTFTVVATGAPTPTYQWQSSMDGGGTWSNVAGATSATLTLTNVSVTNNGHQYRCIITNDQDTVTSRAATLTVADGSGNGNGNGNGNGQGTALFDADIQKAYIAFFNRPADAPGMAFWMNHPPGGMQVLLAEFARSEEYLSDYRGLNHVDTLTRVYRHLFGRDPEPEGLNYWSAQMEAGWVTIINVAYEVLGGARNEDFDIIQNKVLAANAFTGALDTPPEIEAYNNAGPMGMGSAAKDWLARVNEYDASVEEAYSTLDALINELVNRWNDISSQN